VRLPDFHSCQARRAQPTSLEDYPDLVREAVQNGEYLANARQHVWFRSIRLRSIPRDEKLERSEITPMPIPPTALEKEWARRCADA
jgi:hypothetical protein